MNPTKIRFAILSIATANAFLLYLDRICMGAVVQSTSFQTELGLSKEATGDVLAGFFLAYALGQLPAGWMADRFGPRRMLVIYILCWSVFTAATGIAGGLLSLIVIRGLCGLAEAGAYPASALLMTRWFPFTQRARANSIIGFGGRVGNALALGLTATAIAYLGNWRTVLWIYGSIGVVLALLTQFVFRDHPSQHPWVNEAEKNLISEGQPPQVGRPKDSPWFGLLKHKGLWFFNVGALGMNVGWAFIITWLPTYLHEVRGLDKVTASSYVSIALACSLGGMLFGGWYCDTLTKRYGQKWGRRLPFLTGSALAASAYLLCPLLASPLAVAIACGAVAFATDSVNPAMWALAQDIGGRHVAATLAWSNMWGNFGASAVAKLIPFVIGTSLHFADWREIFWLCAFGFVVLGLTSLGIDVTKKLQTSGAEES
ncbi:MFS transporter [Bryobacter aggregatus]|uniref:MFS transporter n=1 Tax=Bryobacter aggregatus TaxID=360054 RepID=UPI00068CE4E0|nr:MFS transporter [Bryobacter aggregatus]